MSIEAVGPNPSCIESLRFNIDGQTFELNAEQAKRLLADLKALLEPPTTYVPMPYYVPQPSLPEPRQWWQEDFPVYPMVTYSGPAIGRLHVQ